MSTCLDNLVGVYCPDGVPNTDSPSYFLSELPGINLAGSAMTADHESKTGEGLMNRAIAFSKKVIKRDFLSLLKKDQHFMEVVSSEVVGRHGTNFIGNVAQDTGVLYSMYDPNDRFIKGYLEYLEVKIEADAAGTTINWQIDNNLPESKSVDLVAGYNKIDMKIDFNETIRVWIDTTSVSLSNGAEGITGTTSRTCLGCDESVCDGCVFFNSITSPVGAQTWTESNTYNGIVGAVQCRGDVDELICMHADELATALLYRSGMYIMNERLASDRNNPYVRNTKDEARALLLSWGGGIDGLTGYKVKGEYPRYLSQAVDNAIQTGKRSKSKAFRPTSVMIGDAIFSSRQIRRKKKPNTKFLNL